MAHHIVVIDDAPDIVQFYTELLTSEGYDVVGAFAGPPHDPRSIEALSPDLIITDWHFGQEVTGLHTLDILQAYPPTAGIPIIVCATAQRALRTVESILVQRGVRILHKPFALHDLVALIQEALVS